MWLWLLSSALAADCANRPSAIDLAVDVRETLGAHLDLDVARFDAAADGVQIRLVCLGEPIPTEGLDANDRDALKQRVREAIEKGIDPGRQT